jgi:Type II secretion system (T2SS), protein M subtype b
MKNPAKWLLSLSMVCGLPIGFGILVLWQSTTLHHQESLTQTEQRAKLLGIVEYGHVSQSSLGHEIDIERHLIGAEDTPSLRAELQALVKDLAAQRGLQVFQASEESGENFKSTLKAVRLRLEVAGVWSSALQFLQDIESQQKWLFVDNLTMRSSEQESVTPTGEPQVQMSILISGLVPAERTEP